MDPPKGANVTSRAIAAPRVSHPILVAALLYAVLAALFVSPALAPGKVFSNSDINWFSAPFEAGKPADLKRAANLELGDVPAQLQPFTQYAKRPAAGCGAVESAPHVRAAVPGQRAVGDLLALQRARVRAAAVLVAGSDRGTEAVRGGARDIPAGPRAGTALRRRAAGRVRLRVQPLAHRLALVSPRQRVDAHPLAAAGHRRRRAPSRWALLRGAGDRGGARLACGPSRVELSRLRGRSRVLRAARAAGRAPGLGRGRGRGPGRPRCSSAP